MVAVAELEVRFNLFVVTMFLESLRLLSVFVLINTGCLPIFALVGQYDSMLVGRE